MLLTFSQARDLYNKARDKTKGYKLENNTWLVKCNSGYGVLYHSTIIVEITNRNTYILDNGNWFTLSTKDRISRYSPVSVWSENGIWSIYNSKNYSLYYHNIEILDDGTIIKPKDLGKINSMFNQYRKDKNMDKVFKKGASRVMNTPCELIDTGYESQRMFNVNSIYTSCIIYQNAVAIKLSKRRAIVFYDKYFSLSFDYDKGGIFPEKLERHTWRRSDYDIVDPEYLCYFRKNTLNNITKKALGYEKLKKKKPPKIKVIRHRNRIYIEYGIEEYCFYKGGFFSKSDSGEKVNIRRLFKQKKPNIQDVLMCTNSELRADLFKLYTKEEIEKHLELTKIDTWNSYNLYISGLNEHFVMLEMINPSTNEIHREYVHPSCNTVKDALAWRNGMNKYIEPITLT